MGNLQKKCRTTGKKSLLYRGKSGQNTGNDCLALGLGVVLYLAILDRVLGKGSEKGVCYGFHSRKGF